jgi:hypothetical protein
LIASAHFGAYVAGTDIDYNLLLGIGLFFFFYRFQCSNIKMISARIIYRCFASVSEPGTD